MGVGARVAQGSVIRLPPGEGQRNAAARVAAGRDPPMLGQSPKAENDGENLRQALLVPASLGAVESF